MFRFYTFFTILFSCLALAIPLHSLSQERPPKTFSVNDLHSFAGDSSDTAFRAFGEMVKDYKIVGLGEDTHGVHDFYLLKKRLISFLVKNYGFNTVVIEDNDPEVTRINEATLQGKGDETIYQKYLTPYLRYCSLFDIINWVRDHNQQAEQKVQLYGMDMQSSKEAIAISTELTRKANDQSLYNDWLDLSRKISDLHGAQHGNKKLANSLSVPRAA